MISRRSLLRAIAIAALCPVKALAGMMKRLRRFFIPLDTDHPWFPPIHDARLFRGEELDVTDQAIAALAKGYRIADLPRGATLIKATLKLAVDRYPLNSTLGIWFNPPQVSDE